jgi:hypothetical protein
MGASDSKSKSNSNLTIFANNLDDKTAIRKSSTFYLENINNSITSLKPIYTEKEKLKRKQNESTSLATTSRNSIPFYVATDANKKRMVLQPKVNQIYDDYIISKQVLGLGISGKVLCCTSKTSNKKYALKVDTN